MTNRFESDKGFIRKETGPSYGGAGIDGVARPVAVAPPGMRRAHSPAKPVPFNGLLTNKLLTALPGEDFARLLRHLEPVSLSGGADLYGFGKCINEVYFPESVVISHLHILADGSATEAAMIGKEGMTGLSAIFDSPAPTHWTHVVIAGTALRASVQVLKEEFARGGAMQRLLLAYASERIEHLAQRAICNIRHTVEERLCSWLLMIHDRAGDDQLLLTHEQIARHLGTRRAGITEATNVLRERGIINNSRGQIRIANRPELELAACECYRTLKRQNLTSAQS
jgi:CRP-like cAMP-binding protein